MAGSFPSVGRCPYPSLKKQTLLTSSEVNRLNHNTPMKTHSISFLSPLSLFLKRLDETSLRFVMLGVGAVSALTGQTILSGPELGFAPADRAQLQTLLETILDPLIDSYVILRQEAWERGGPSIRVSAGGEFVSFYERLPLSDHFDLVYERAGPLVLRVKGNKPDFFKNGRSLSLADALEQVSKVPRSGLTTFLQGQLQLLAGGEGPESGAATRAGLGSESYSAVALSGRLDPVDLLLRQGYRFHPFFEHAQTAVRVLVDEAQTPCYAVFQPESLEARYFIDLRLSARHHFTCGIHERRIYADALDE